MAMFVQAGGCLVGGRYGVHTFSMVVAAMTFCRFSFGLLLCALFSVLFPVFAGAATGIDSVPTVRITETGAEPATITIEEGGTVFFINSRDEPVWIASDVHPTHTAYPGSDIRVCGTPGRAPIFDSCEGVAPSARFIFRFEKAGTWGYHDHLHPDTAGTVIVMGETARGEEEWRSALSWPMKVRAAVLNTWYRFRPDDAWRALREMDLFAESRSDASLEYLLRVFGHEPLLEAFEKGDPENPQVSITCHVPGHYLGRLAHHVLGISALEEKNIHMGCQRGFYHGVIEASLGNLEEDEAIRLVGERCAKHGDDIVRRASCYHAIGHGILVNESYDLPSALKRCRVLENEKTWELCYFGAFMENSVVAMGFGLGHTTSWIRSEDSDYPCTAPEFSNDPLILRQCYFSQSVLWSVPLFRPQALIDGCMRSPLAVRSHCFQGIGFNAVSWSMQRPQVLMELCSLAPSMEYREHCAAGLLMMSGGVFAESTDFHRSPFCELLNFKVGDERCNPYVLNLLSWAVDF